MTLRGPDGRFMKAGSKTKKKAVAKKAVKKATPKKVAAPRLKQYVGISRDHSVSMSNLRNAAMNDYNSIIDSIKKAASEQNIDTVVSVVLNGVSDNDRYNNRGVVKREIVNSSIHALTPLTRYETTGGSTPLWDSVGELIEILERVPDFNDPNVSFLIMIVTDGGENSSTYWNTARLAAKIKQLQATDRFTFVWRVPKGQRYSIIQKLGVYDDNVIEWDTSDSRDLDRTSGLTQSATAQYFAGRSVGHTASSRFYANMAAKSVTEVKKTLDEIKDILKFHYVTRDSDISTFITEKTNRCYVKGTAFYQLTKTEDVQYHKAIVIRNRKTNKSYTGDAARQLLGLPTQGTIRLSPGNNGDFDVFVQSTSLNRKLIAGTTVLYWANATMNMFV